MKQMHQYIPINNLQIFSFFAFMKKSVGFPKGKPTASILKDK